LWSAGTGRTGLGAPAEIPQRNYWHGDRDDGERYGRNWLPNCEPKRDQ